MGAKASIHMQPMKAMNASLSDENERRDKSKEWFDRTEDSKGTPYHYDWWRRNLNFEIVKGKICPQLSHTIPLHERLQNRLRELGFKNYKVTARNAPNVCMDFVIGGQRERMREMAFGQQVVNFECSDVRNSHVKRCDEIERWAMDTYKWAAIKYGEENIIGFNVHLDETTPHIHMQVVPVAERKRRGRVKAGQERGTVKTVSYAGIIGEKPESLAKYLDDMHTDYHLQVGYKYGLERGTFFDDLTPEEQALRPKGNRPKAEYIIVEKIRDEIKKLQTMKEELNGEIKVGADRLKLLEKKEKSFKSMISKLNDQKERLEIEITALEEIRDTDNEEVEKQLQEKQKLLDGINEKIVLRTGQLNDVTEDLAKTRKELEKLDEVRFEAKQNIRKMAANATNAQDRINKRLKETEQLIKETDKGGMIERRDRYADDRDGIIFAVWPEAKNALASMVQRASKPVNMFTKEQAESINNALDKYPKGRESGAEALEKMSEREFNENHANISWIPETLKEVKQIAKRTHPLIAALSQGRSNNDGSASYITDLTDWAGNKIKM